MSEKHGPPDNGRLTRPWRGRVLTFQGQREAPRRGASEADGKGRTRRTQECLPCVMVIHNKVNHMQQLNRSNIKASLEDTIRQNRESAMRTVMAEAAVVRRRRNGKGPLGLLPR